MLFWRQTKNKQRPAALPRRAASAGVRVRATGLDASRKTFEVANAISRQGAIALDRSVPTESARANLIRIASLFVGSTFIGLGVSFFVHARLGVAPYDVLLTALSSRSDLTIGQAGWLMAGILFSVATLLGQRPRISGLAYVAANGFAVDIAIGLIRDAEPMGLRITFVLLGMAAIVAGITLVVHSGLTGGAFELLMNAGRERGFDPIRVRTALEVIILIIGMGLGGDFGIATIAFAALVGPTMRTFNQALGDHRQGRVMRRIDTREELVRDG